jgi:hypothetical protein
MCGSPIERTITVKAVPWKTATINFLISEWKWIFGAIISIIGAIAAIIYLIDWWNSRKKQTQVMPNRDVADQHKTDAASPTTESEPFAPEPSGPGGDDN